MNLTQIGVRSLEKKVHSSLELISPTEISTLQTFRSSGLQLKANALNLPSQTLSLPGTSINSNSNSNSATATASASPMSPSTLGLFASPGPGLKDSKKNSWQTRGISLPSTGPESPPPPVSVTTTKNLSSSMDKASSSWVGAKSSMGLGLSLSLGQGQGQGQDNNSDDGVGGVSNSEVEDEWLEVKQRKPKGAFSNASSNTTSGKGGAQTTTSTSTLKGVRSRSTSPAATSIPVSSSNSNISESFAAILLKKEEIIENTISQPPVLSSTSGYASSVGPSVQIPVVSTMGFRAAVMNGQNEISPTTSSFAQTQMSASSQLGPASMQQPQSFSPTDFPAMPTSSSSASKVSAAIMTRADNAPTATSVVALGGAAASAVGAAAMTPSFATTVCLPAADAVDKRAALVGSLHTVKKLPKTKKKAVKNGIEVISEKESFVSDGTGATAITATNSTGRAECAELAAASADAVGFDIKNGNTFEKPVHPLPICLPTPVLLNLPDKSEYGIGSLEGTETYKDPRLQQMPVLTAQGSYASHITQSSYDMHTVNHDQANGVRNLHNDENCISSNQFLPQTEMSTIHMNNMHQQMQIHSTDASNRDYQYSYQQRPKGDEEDDDDLFKAISSAHAIDFDPSFTANSLNLSNNRPISCTLSPLSRRIGSRPERDHDAGIGLPSRQSINLDTMRMSPYESSSLLDPTGKSPPIGPQCVSSSSHSNTEGFLSGISFDFFSSLLHSSHADGSSGMQMRKEGSLEILPHMNSTDLIPSNQTPHRYTEQQSLLAMDTMNLNDLQSGLSPLCQEYRYTGSLPEITENDSSSTYQETDSHKIRYQMPALTPILPNTLMPPLQTSYISNGSVDLHHISHSSIPITHSHYQNGIMDLSQNLQKSYVSLPVLLTAKELSLGTSNFSTSNLVELMETKQLHSPNNNCILKTNRAKLLLEKEKEKEKEKEASVCTFFGTIRSNHVIIKIITQNNDTDINNALQSQFLADLRVLSEVSHPNILPLLGYTFRPCARVFRVPLGMMNMDTDKSIYNNNVDNNSNGSNSCNNNSNITNDNNNSNNNHSTRSDMKQSGSVGFYTLGNLLQDNERRKLFPWKFRIRIIICILRALGYLHLGDRETGRCPIAHW